MPSRHLAQPGSVLVAPASGAESGALSLHQLDSPTDASFAATPQRARFRALPLGGGWASIRSEGGGVGTAPSLLVCSSEAGDASGPLRLREAGSHRDTAECAFRFVAPAATYKPLSMWARPPKGRGFTFVPLKVKSAECRLSHRILT